MTDITVTCENCIRVYKCETVLTLHPNDAAKDSNCITGIIFALPASLLIWFLIINLVLWLT